MNKDQIITEAERVLVDLGLTLAKKNADYGNSFEILRGKYGLAGTMIRLSDKMNRLDNLIHLSTEPEVEESVEDTLRDLAGYAVLELAYRRLQA